jgi:hypothetical protein
LFKNTQHKSGDGDLSSSKVLLFSTPWHHFPQRTSQHLTTITDAMSRYIDGIIDLCSYSENSSDSNDSTYYPNNHSDHDDDDNDDNGNDNDGDDNGDGDGYDDNDHLDVIVVDLTQDDDDDDDDNDSDNDNDDDYNDDDNDIDNEDVEVIKDTTNNNNTTRQCPICLEEIPEGSIRFLPCMHSFHNICVTTWTEINNSCPVCKNNNAT